MMQVINTKPYQCYHSKSQTLEKLSYCFLKTEIGNNVFLPCSILLTSKHFLCSLLSVYSCQKCLTVIIYISHNVAFYRFFFSIIFLHCKNILFCTVSTPIFCVIVFVLRSSVKANIFFHFTVPYIRIHVLFTRYPNNISFMSVHIATKVTDLLCCAYLSPTPVQTPTCGKVFFFNSFVNYQNCLLIHCNV